MSTHLTIDLDYYDMGCEHKDEKVKFINFVNRVINTGKPIIHILYHNEIIEHINAKKYDSIVNVDYHSDIVYDDMIKWNDPNEFNEGTWANFYPFKKDCVFEWRYPSTEECFRQRWGRCEWTESTKEPFQKSRMGYKNIKRRQGLKSIDLKSIQDVSICYSPNWCKNKRTYFDLIDAIGSNEILQEAIEYEYEKI